MTQTKNDVSRGSEWRKWDLQIHTPASHLNNQFGSDWDTYVQGLFRAAIAKDIAVIGVTDYFTIDGYKTVKEQYLTKPAKLAQLFSPQELERIGRIRVFPNVEFRLNKLVGSSRINCHVIFSDEVPIKDIEENFLHDLSFTNEAQPQSTAEKRKLKVQNLEEFGARLIKEHPPFADKGNALFVGMTNAVVDDDDILERLQDSRFRDKFLFCVVADEDLSKLNWNSQDHHVRKVLIQRSDALFAGNPSTRNWALARPPQYVDGEAHFISEFKGLKPCIHGSDSHGYDEIGHPCAKRGRSGHACESDPTSCDLRYCWIKADTTFEGLRQIIHEPADRIFIGPSAPEYHDQARVIRSVTIANSQGWFADGELPLNGGLVSIIGQKGSGKSALADLIAFAAGSWDSEDEKSFLVRAAGYVDGLEIMLEWAEGDPSSGRVRDISSHAQQVKYLSQNYVDRICSRDGITKELVREIEKVIFNYLDPTDTLNASSFDELRALKTEGIRQEGERLRAEIQTIIREECALRDLIAKLPEKRARLKTLTTERDGLTKQLPPPATFEEAKLIEELQTKRVALTRVQQSAASEKQTLQRIADLRTRIGAFRAQMDRFYSELEPALNDLGIPKPEWTNFRPTFAGDIDAPLAVRTQAISQRLTGLEGHEPPADGTIKKLLRDIEALTQRETVDKARQERTKQIQTRIAIISTESERLNTEIETIETVERPRLTNIQTQRLDAYIAFFENLKIEQTALQALYEPIRDQLREQALLEGKELEFAIRWAPSLSGWLERGSPLFDQRRTLPYGTFEKLGQEAKRTLLPAWSSGDPQRIRNAFETFMSEFRKQDLPWKEYVRSGVTLQDVLMWLYEVDHISLEYGLKFNGADLESLSPGTKGIVLLILYLGMDINDTRPLIVDQPDENLDNESIYNLLTPYFRIAKARRQVIVITHNPNLVVNSDSEQVIVASAEKQENGFPFIHYRGGSLENNYPPDTGTRQQVCKLLEGGNIAFQKRERRYAISRL